MKVKYVLPCPWLFSNQIREGEKGKLTVNTSLAGVKCMEQTERGTQHKSEQKMPQSAHLPREERWPAHVIDRKTQGNGAFFFLYKVLWGWGGVVREEQEVDGARPQRMGQLMLGGEREEPEEQQCGETFSLDSKRQH